MTQIQWLAVLGASLCVYGVAGSSDAWSRNVAPGNVVNGEAVYSRCLACHALAYDRTGPRHCGLFGRQAGSIPGYAYSQAMKESKIIWDDDTLNLFLADPMHVVPGTSMGYAGIPDKQERADLIAYLKKENNSAACLVR
ncbi:cytochrome c family protein [Pollutimonas subterranea]|uniref:Cytochrome c family protein n=1 Tax=Pollutimonas subterranea TaxID=2045210 RepID=A0A2N4U176_9BURK|nr:cytochrome c family protein [Pollutimonas subterranea]PLC48757.1 cytochrome c family protein [Pollutimonas subterranea]